MAYNPIDKNSSGVVFFGNNGSDQVLESVNNLVYDTGNTRLGVNTTSPQYTLDVSGTGTFHTIRFADGTQMSTTGGGGGSTSPGGSNTQVQFNDGGSFGGDSNFTWNKSSDTLTISVNHINDALLLTSTEGSSDASPVLTLKRDSSTPADGDYLGQLKFKGESDTSVERVYAKITAKTLDVSNGTEDGLIEYMVREAGSNKIMSRFRGDGIRVLNGANFIAEGDGKVGVGNTSPTYQVDVVGTGNFTGGVRFPDGNVQTVAYTGGGAGGGMTSWDLSVTGDSTTISDGETVTFTGQGSITTTRNANTVIISGAAAGGGTPGGSVSQIQINDGAGGFTAATDSDRLAYIPSTNTLNLGRAIATDLYSGTQVTNFWYGDNFAIGGNNFLSLTNTSDRNTAIGYGAAQSLTGGNDDNVIIGYEALNSTTTNCDSSVFVGSQVASNGGSYIGCIGIGRNILSSNSAGSLVGTIGIGYNVFNALTNGPDYDIGIGYNALNIYNESSTVGGNIAIGYQAMYNISNGQYNVAIGFNALTNAGTRGGIDHNVIIGQGAAQGATTNFANNVVVGSDALGSTTNNLSTENVIIGRSAAQSCTNIDDSIVIGNNALSTLNLATAGNIILNNRDIYGAGGLVASDANRLLIGDTLGGNLSTKRIKIGGSNVVDVDTAVLEVECNSSTDAGLLVQGAASQSANLQEWQDSSSTVLASVDNGGRLYHQSSYSPISDKGTASSFTFDLDTSNVFSGTLNSATSTLATSNGDVGQRFMVRLKQDGTGNRDVSSWFGGRVSWPGGSAPSLSTGANLVDLFGFLVTSGTASTLYYDGFTIATGIQ